MGLWHSILVFSLCGAKIENFINAIASHLPANRLVFLEKHINVRLWQVLIV